MWKETYCHVFHSYLPPRHAGGSRCDHSLQAPSMFVAIAGHSCLRERSAASKHVGARLAMIMLPLRVSTLGICICMNTREHVRIHASIVTCRCLSPNIALEHTMLVVSSRSGIDGPYDRSYFWACPVAVTSWGRCTGEWHWVC